MKTYSTLAGARRANPGRPILRILDDPREVWIPIDRMDTEIMLFVGNETRSSGCIQANEILR
jgi:hypothetical protein